MSRCATYNLFLQQGEAKALHLQYVDSNDDPVVDLSTYEGVLQLRDGPHQGATMLMELTSAADEITFDSVDGSIYVTFPLTKVNDLPVGVRSEEGWYYALQIYDPADKDTTARLLLQGEVTANPSVME